MRSIRLPLLGFLCAAAIGSAPAITLTTLNLAVTEDFNSLAIATGSVVPAGWEFLETGSGANTTYGAGNGSSATGNAYSFGATSSTDRAFGTLRTASLSAMLGTIITNNTSGAITDLEISYYGEQWRLGAIGRPDRLDFSYSLDATSLGNGSWLDLDPLDFTGPTTAGATGALDGDAADNRVLVSYTLSGLNLAPGASLWLRWSDFDATGSDDGLAIDDFSVTGLKQNVQAVPDDLSTAVMAAVLGGVLFLHRALRRKAADVV